MFKKRAIAAAKQKTKNSRSYITWQDRASHLGQGNSGFESRCHQISAVCVCIRQVNVKSGVKCLPAGVTRKFSERSAGSSVSSSSNQGSEIRRLTQYTLRCFKTGR
ncbi:hypothetical protein AVEN_141463-1 [Araneus ventricosus]|uniref:Uncharacterized protein n=1 Tax=Araneus ventricosus TaxID=182803 RepID=A0A4Y2QXT5_ARAVE|nr:hypothetical protein AVEN_141463-1 [Araneus ventricosus]